MRVSRLIFASLVPVIFATVGCGQGGKTPGPGFKPPPAGSRSLKCEGQVTVDTQYTHGVDKAAIYVCEDQAKVTWTKGTTVTTFSLDFGGNCPFKSCSITDSQPDGEVPNNSSQQPLTVYEYKITINGSSKREYDPHVIGGGG